jgi:hypothetical protein
MTTRVQILNNAEVSVPEAEGYKLCFQWCRYVHENDLEYGYRFIWKAPDGKHLAHRGQARIPNVTLLASLVQTAVKEGWGSYDSVAMPRGDVQL